MTSPVFRPGPLSAEDAAALTRLARQLNGAANITAKPPLAIARQGFDGQPILYMDQSGLSSDAIRSYLLDVPCLVLGGGGGLAGIVVDGSGARAECVVKGECGGDCGGGDLPPSPPPPVTATISGAVARTGDAAGPVVGRAVELLATGTTVTTDASGNYSFSSISGPSLRFVQLTLEAGETATNSVDGGGSVAGRVATVYVTTTAHDADFTITPPPPGPPPVSPPVSPPVGGG